MVRDMGPDEALDAVPPMYLRNRTIRSFLAQYAPRDWAEVGGAHTPCSEQLRAGSALWHRDSAISILHTRLTCAGDKAHLAVWHHRP